MKAISPSLTLSLGSHNIILVPDFTCNFTIANKNLWLKLDSNGTLHTSLSELMTIDNKSKKRNKINCKQSVDR